MKLNVKAMALTGALLAWLHNRFSQQGDGR